MKKLVTAACALAAGMAMAQVESANIVGYVTTNATANAFTAAAVMFTDIGQNTLSISSIVFDGVQRGDTIQIFDGVGNVKKTIAYNKRVAAGVFTWDDESYVFQPGDSFWFLPAGAATMKFAGEVSLDPIVIQAPANAFTQMGNGTAAPVALADMTFDGVQRGDTIQIFDGVGNVSKTIAYNKRVSAGVFTWDDDAVFQPGDAFWFLPAGAVTVTIPAPTLAQQ